MVSNLPISVNKIKLSNSQAMIIIGFGGTDFRFDDEIDLLVQSFYEINVTAYSFP